MVVEMTNISTKNINKVKLLLFAVFVAIAALIFSFYKIIIIKKQTQVLAKKIVGLKIKKKHLDNELLNYKFINSVNLMAQKINFMDFLNKHKVHGAWVLNKLSQNTPDDIFLKKVLYKDEQLNVEGESVSNITIAEFVKKLEAIFKTTVSQDVKIKSKKIAFKNFEENFINVDVNNYNCKLNKSVVISTFKLSIYVDSNNNV